MLCLELPRHYIYNRSLLLPLCLSGYRCRLSAHVSQFVCLVISDTSWQAGAIEQFFVSKKYAEIKTMLTAINEQSIKPD